MTTQTDADLWEVAIESRLLDVWTCLPGYVAQVYSDRGYQYVDVVPAVRRPVRTAEDELVAEELPVLTGVPVGFPQGGGFFLSMPLKVGDVVTVVFAQWSIDGWTEQGKRGATAAVDAPDVGSHRADGAIALPCGPMPVPSLLADVSSEKLVIAEDGGVKLEMGQGSVSVLGDLKVEGSVDLGELKAADFVALAAKVDAEIKRLDQAIETLKSATSAGLNTAGTSTAAAATGSVAQAAFDAATAGVPGSAGGTGAERVRAS